MTTCYPERNFTIRRGNTGTCENPAGIVMTFKAGEVLEPLAGTTFHFFTKTVNDLQMTKSSEVANEIVIDEPTSTVTIPITLTDSRLWQAGNVVGYEVEQRATGLQRTRLTGMITVEGGFNDD